MTIDHGAAPDPDPGVSPVVDTATDILPAGTYPNPTLEEFFTVALSLLQFNQYGGTEVVRPELVTAWVTMATFEDSHAAWNPADTTYMESGATPYNSFGPGGSLHVWNYASAEQGMSAFLSTLGLPAYAPLRRAMLDPTSSLEVLLAAIATSPWTGIASDPGLYNGVVAEPTRVVEGPGGWPWAPKPADPVVTPAEEQAKVVDAIGAEEKTLEADEAKGDVTDAKTVAAQLLTHAHELVDLVSALVANLNKP